MFERFVANGWFVAMQRAVVIDGAAHQLQEWQSTHPQIRLRESLGNPFRVTREDASHDSRRSSREEFGGAILHSRRGCD